MIAYIECRTYGHAWSEDNVLIESKGFAVVKLQCARCLTERVDIVHVKAGRVLKRKYLYATGYVVKGGVRRADARKELYGKEGQR